MPYRCTGRHIEVPSQRIALGTLPGRCEMALRPCSECGREVSDTAAVCPQCGVNFPGSLAKQKGMKVAVKVMIVGAAITVLAPLIALLLVSIFG